MQHGGSRTPAQPAAVSGPGRFSKRTDGKAQMAASGGPYGARQALEAQQQAAPVPVGQGGALIADQPAQPPVDDPGAFGPTQRPNELPTAGAAPVDAADQLLDPNMIFEVLAEKWPTPWILGMINRA